METKSKTSPARRSMAARAKRRLKIGFWSLFRRRHRQIPPESRPRRRLREDQITIDVLRFRLAHPGAVRENGDGMIYSAAFQNFILNRYAQEKQKFTRRKFARAAEISAPTLRVWLSLPRAPLLAGLEALRAAETGVVPAFALQTTPKPAWKLAPAFAAIELWLRTQFQSDLIDFFSLTGYGRVEVRKYFQKNAWRGLAVAGVLHALLILLYWSTLDKDENMRTVSILKYVEIKPVVVSDDSKPERRKLSGGAAAETPASGSVTAGSAGPLVVPDNFVPMASIEQLNQIAQLGRPTIPGLAPPSRITSSLQASNLPELNMGNIGDADKNAPDYQDLAGVGLPTAANVGNGYGSDLQAASIGTGSGSGGMGYGPGGGNGPGNGSGYSRGSGGGGGLESAVGNKAPAAPKKVEVKDKDLETVDLNKVFTELMEWMKSNQTEFEPILKRYLRYQPGSLTTNIRITVDAMSYDLFILCNEHSQDIGILLVEAGSGNAIMLRDTGFRKKSFYLSKGRTSRDEEGMMASLTMLENSPSREETKKFYDIFLSWWENNRKR